MTPTFCHDHMKLGDHDHKLQLFNGNTQPSSSTISTHVLSCSSMQDQGSYYPREAHQLKYQQEANNFSLEGGSSNDRGLNLCLWKSNNKQGNQITGHHRQTIPTKWLPTKLRLARKMTGSDWTATEAPSDPSIKLEEYHKRGSSSPVETTENSSNNSFSNPVRVCSDCNTSKTPLWRSGPRGPKSLCNACGIRQRKARQALVAAVAAANGTVLATEDRLSSKPKVQQKDKRLKTNTRTAPCKKKFKTSNNNERKNKICFQDFLISLSKNSAFHQVFPQDEKEAAILLMALSCDLVHG